MGFFFNVFSSHVRKTIIFSTGLNQEVDNGIVSLDRVFDSEKSSNDRKLKKSDDVADLIDISQHVNESVDCCKFTPKLLLPLKIFNISLKYILL